MRLHGCGLRKVTRLRKKRGRTRKHKFSRTTVARSYSPETCPWRSSPLRRYRFIEAAVVAPSIGADLTYYKCAFVTAHSVRTCSKCMSTRLDNRLSTFFAGVQVSYAAKMDIGQLHTQSVEVVEYSFCITTYLKKALLGSSKTQAC